MKALAIDVHSIMFVLAMVNLIMAAFLGMGLRLTRGGDSGLRLFLFNKTFQGLSWGLRLVAFLGGPAWLHPLANMSIVTGFILEAGLFLAFKKSIPKRTKAVSAVLLGAALPVFFLLDGSGAENLLVLLIYFPSMFAASYSLVFRDPTTRFQRFIGLIYGTIPLASVILYVAAGPEVTSPGYETTALGFAYHAAIITMQMVGSVGYLLIVGERNELRLAETASRDPLTGILNRRAFFERAELLLANAVRGGDSVSVIIMDLDHFKAVNDTRGHLVGDQVLRRFCDTVGAEIRRGDLFARYGGEEFVILLSKSGKAEAAALIRRMRKALASKDSDKGEGLPRITASMGVSSGVVGRVEDLDRFLKAGDEALYLAKNSGRDRAYWADFDSPGDAAEPI